MFVWIVFIIRLQDSVNIFHSVHRMNNECAYVVNFHLFVVWCSILMDFKHLNNFQSIWGQSGSKSCIKCIILSWIFFKRSELWARESFFFFFNFYFCYCIKLVKNAHRFGTKKSTITLGVCFIIKLTFDTRLDFRGSNSNIFENQSHHHEDVRHHNFRGSSGVVGVFFKHHTYNYSDNGERALISLNLKMRTIILGQNGSGSRTIILGQKVLWILRTIILKRSEYETSFLIATQWLQDNH